MFKMIILLVLIVSNVSFAASIDCSGAAMQKATAKYVMESGSIQGSDGPEVFVELELHAKSPFYNFIVGIYDNNEDGETWTSYYFVMTKFENNKCDVLKVKPAEEAALKINSYFDFVNQVDLESPQDFILNRQMLTDYNIDFKTFIDPDTSICYQGDAQWVLDIIETLFYNHPGGDSVILNSSAIITNGRITHYGAYTEGSGDHDFSLDFEIEKCK